MSQPPVDFNGLDTRVHGPIRLGVLTAPQIDGPLDFTTLKKQLQVADGALGLRTQKPEEVGSIRSIKEFIGRRPRTTYVVTPEGSRALDNYLETMRRLVVPWRPPGDSRGWAKPRAEAGGKRARRTADTRRA